MDGSRFDRITRRFVAGAGSRRALAVATVALAVSLPTPVNRPAPIAAVAEPAGGRCGPRRTRCGKRCCPRHAPICCGKKRCCQMHEVCGRKQCIRK